MLTLVTGSAGFIGFHVCKALLNRGEDVVGLDNVNDYYDVRLKEARLTNLRQLTAFKEIRADIADRIVLSETFQRFKPSRVIHLAAQAGVRYSLNHPEAYVDSNLVGFSNILEACRRHETEHLVFASTSSVYGANQLMPFSEQQSVSHPMSFYAASKRANEVMAHSYSHLFTLPMTGLRFFTAYGPFGRPDMALFKFTKAILADQPIDVYNGGDMKRDFTYIDDIVEGIVRVRNHIPTKSENWNADCKNPFSDRSGIAPFRIFNIGRGEPIQLMDFIRTLEEKLQRRARLNLLPLQAGDVTETFADTSALSEAVGYAPETSVDVGVGRFVDWYRSFYNV